MLQPRPYWTNYMLWDGRSYPVARILAARDAIGARARQAWQRIA